MREQTTTDLASELKRLQHSMNDLVSVLALPVIWSDSEPNRILDTFLDALMGILDLNFLYARVRIDSGGGPIEVLKTAQQFASAYVEEEIGRSLKHMFGEDQQQWPGESLVQAGERVISIFPIRMGMDSEIGLIVAGSDRAGFPEQAERLMLSVAANQAAIGLQQALRRNEQKRIADELDRRVAERTRELAEANEELKLQVGLLQHLPVSAWTLRPDGTPDFVNQVWLRFSGQTLDFVRSHPEAWMAAVHPDDREAAIQAFRDGISSGQGFAIETRSRRAEDGTYRWHLQQTQVLRDANGKVLKFVGTTTDIDEQKRAQEAFKVSEANLVRVIDTIPTLTWSMFPDGPNEFLSKRWHDYTGHSVEESRGWGWQTAFHPDDLPSLMDKWREMLSSGEPGDVEARIRRYDGVYRWFLIRAAPFRDESGRISRWYGTSTDIDDRKRAEDTVLANERNLGLIISAMPVLAWSASADGNVDFFNERWLEFTGLSLTEAQNWGWSKVFHPDDLGMVEEYWRSRIASGQAGEIEARLRRFDGTYRWFLFRANPWRAESGEIVKWYGTNTDIDDRKHAEDELKRSEARYRVVIETANDAVVSIDEDGEIILANPATRRIFGWDPEELIGRPLTILMPGAIGKLHDAGFARYLATGERLMNWQGAELVALRANGEEFPVEVSFGEMIVDQRRVFTGFIRDSSEKKRAEEGLRSAQAELARMMRVATIGQLTASITHEINQPLSGIVTNASTCLRMLRGDPPNIAGAMETAQRTIRDGNRASEVITRLRSLFSKRQVDVAPLDLNEAAREVIALLSGELEKNNVILKSEFDERLPAVNGNRIQLQQVILNLLRNAADAMSCVDHRPRKVTIRTELKGEEVHLSVEDSGVGLSAEIADRMFESFYTTKQDGMGVGLSVSHSIIEANKGRIWGRPNDVSGATFTFSIPCA